MHLGGLGPYLVPTCCMYCNVGQH